MADSIKENKVNQGQYHFICGSDDYLVDREGRKLYEKYTAELVDDFSREIIDADAQNLGKVGSILKQFIESAQMPSLFGGKKILWLRGVNFLADSPTGRSEGAKNLVEMMVEILRKLDYEKVGVIITASPVDKRTRGFKALKNTSFFKSIEDEASLGDLTQIVFQEFQSHSIKISQDAVEVLLMKVNGNSRLLMQEIQKLITFLGSENDTIDVKLVNEMVAQFGEGDFFEFSEAFFSLDINWTLEALTRHFFTQKESRPLIASLLNRMRLMIQLRVLLDAGSIEASSYGLNKNTLQSLALQHDLPFGDAAIKSGFNVFTQHPWYLGKLAVAVKKISLRKLIDFETYLIEAFESILKYSQPHEQEAIMRQLVVKCLI